MKKLVAVVALSLVLAACGEAADESDEPEAAETPAAAETADSSAGNYEVTMADGTKFTSMLNADGTYMDMDAEGNTTESGTWEDRADGKTCFDSEGGDDTIICFTMGEEQADGSIVVTPDDGSDPLTIKRTS